ncbi:sugar phosphate isomerase/epimerase [Gulosibacter sp. 10]|uniref:sugar phosphate isomerase/epimerase family protein n=1 Tax=Gulosibacter sp. 10 TaxID=1255570 RepID=UPI00097ED2A1|nr:sugar phosphate isomerase/epimerase [Gulosibacter sp. 10]SJM49360.1 Inosose isomerase [Gulosibacter sp. 10]
MHIGVFTDGFERYGLTDMLMTCEQLGIRGVELGCANWSKAPHVPVEDLLSGATSREEYLDQFERHGVQIDALNCSGNILHPIEGAAHRDGLSRTMSIAAMLGVNTVVTTSGLPGGSPTDRRPNWVTTHWPPENHEILAYQWDEVAIPVWREIVEEARALGVRIAFELHPTCLLYNLSTFEHLCERIGDCKDVLGINMDPSHLMWMGGDGRELVRRAPESIFHVHLKDVVFHEHQQLVDGNLDFRQGANISERSWSFDVPGKGRDAEWWSLFLDTLKTAGYDGILAVELEDYTGYPKNPLREAVEFISPLLADYQ